ncbi:MAG: 2-oxo acid dehydrogenase subunit E2 [Clostridiales bacterium]|nr:2-oxo acid dehydrogenase subunit E2 [Clostridiales bacterium]
MFGRRPDGRRVKGTDPIVQMTPYLMPMRCDAQVFLEHRLDYEMLSRYIARKSTEGQKVTFMQLIVAAYVRGVSQHPEINRFIKNKQYFARNNLSVSFTILKESQNHDSPESTVRIEFDPTDTLFDVRDRMVAAVEANRGAGPEGDVFIDKLAGGVLKVPGLPNFIVALVRLLDRYGLAPGAFLRELPFYSSMFITNNASIGLHHVWHHIYNFGTVSAFFGLGSVLKEATVDAEGKARMKRWLPIGVTVDERVTSGAHYAAFFADVVRCLNHPELLESPPESVRYDGDVEYHVPKLTRN